MHEIERYSSIEETRGGKVRHETRAIRKELMHAKSMVESKQGEISRMKAQAANLEQKNQKN